MAYQNKLHLIYGDGTLGVQGEGFAYLFSYERGGLESLKVGGKEWLYREPKPTFWRATTDNDRGNGFNLKAAQWLAADYFVPCTKVTLKVDDHKFKQVPIAPATNRFTANETAKKVKITFTYQTLTTPATTVTVAYKVKAGGKLKVTAKYHGQAGLPELPVFGMRFVMPTMASGYEYEGLSGETYPDRMAGGRPGTYAVKGLPVTKYLVPQENGMHMATKWVRLTRQTTQNNADPDLAPYSLTFKAGKEDFAFSALPYTSEELENATHHEELPPARRTVLVIAGAVRGVGGIDSWGADVQPAYHIASDQDHRVSFTIVPG